MVNKMLVFKQLDGMNDYAKKQAYRVSQLLKTKKKFWKEHREDFIHDIDEMGMMLGFVKVEANRLKLERNELFIMGIIIGRFESILGLLKMMASEEEKKR